MVQFRASAPRSFIGAGVCSIIKGADRKLATANDCRSFQPNPFPPLTYSSAKKANNKTLSQRSDEINIFDFVTLVDAMMEAAKFGFVFTLKSTFAKRCPDNRSVKCASSA